MLRDTYTGILLNIFVLTQIIEQSLLGHVDSAWQKTITSISTHPGHYEPENAIDGNPGRDPEDCQCCAATRKEPNPWYQLDFGENHTIHRIHVEGRIATQIYGQHFQGMWIYLKSVHDGILFGEEIRITEATYNVDYVLPVPKSTRYVSLVLRTVTRIFLICELTVYGECTEGKFGGYCESICQCDEVPCNTPTGECPSGKCLPGYNGTSCDKVCPDGTYGPGCPEKCGNCIGTDICSKQDGRCPDQCASGYQGDTCKQRCDDGFYGQGCGNVCGKCHNGEPCNAVTGHCENGCVTGYQTDALCKTECIPGTYGVGCTRQCGNCKGGTTVCVKTDGSCPAGCVAGYKGGICTTECKDGTYGENCNSNCGNCSGGTTCNKETGVCVSGCSDGYTGDICVDKCQPGVYGNSCSNTCGNCTTDTTCHHINGTCIGGCKAGFKDPLCNEECEDGAYGENCHSNCGNCLNGTTCNKETGVCVGGCRTGYTGDMCVNSIQDEADVNHYKILAISGWSFGGLVLMIAIGSIVLMRIRRTRANKEKVRAESRLYEIPNTRNNLVDQEHPYGSVTGNTQDHVYANKNYHKTRWNFKTDSW